MRIGRNTMAYGLMAAGIAITAAGGPVTGATAASANASVPAAASESGTLNCTQLEALWEKAGGSPSAAFLAAEVAMAESAGKQYAANVNPGAGTDEGYWQINNYYHPAQATFDPLGNAQAAVSISSDGTNWTPWMTYDSGAQVGQCH